MKTIEVNVYKFAELSEEAKKKAIDTYRNKYYDNQFHYDEIIESAKAVAELFDLKFGREYTDVRTSHIDDDILNLSGIRLYKYIWNNYGGELFKPKYIKTINRELRCKQFVCKVYTGHSGNKYTQIHSRNFTDNSCVLTGMCFDDSILQPVYDFLKKPENHITFADIISDIESAISKAFRDTEEWVNSEEYISEEIEANDYEFTEDGNRF